MKTIRINAESIETPTDMMQSLCGDLEKASGVLKEVYKLINSMDCHSFAHCVATSAIIKEHIEDYFVSETEAH